MFKNLLFYKSSKYLSENEKFFLKNRWWVNLWVILDILQFFLRKRNVFKSLCYLFEKVPITQSVCFVMSRNWIKLLNCLSISLSVLEACQQTFFGCSTSVFCLQIEINRKIFCMHFTRKRNKKERTLEMSMTFFSLPIHKSSCRQVVTT